MLKKLTNTIAFILIIGQCLHAQSSGRYYIQSKIQGKYMNVKDVRSDNGTPIHLWDWNTTLAQKFTLEDAGDGYFYIKSDLGKYLHIKDPSNQTGVIVHLWSGKGYDNTKWRFESIGNDYLIRSKKGTYMEVKGGKSANGTPIWMSNKTVSNAQQWKLIPINDKPKKPQVKNGCVVIPQVRAFNLGEKCISSIYGHLLNNHREFDGPVIVKGQISLSSSKDFKNITCKLSISMEGTKSNTPKIQAKWSDIVYTAPQGFIIPHVYKSIQIPRTVLPRSGTEWGLGCNDGEKHIINLVGSNGIIELIADTGAEDISDDADCGCDSKILRVLIPSFMFKIKCEDMITEKSGKYRLKNKQKNANLTDQLKFKRNPKADNNTKEYSDEVLFYIERNDMNSNVIHIKSEKNGKYLSVVNGKLVYVDKKGNNTAWVTQRMENGYYRIVHRDTGYVLHSGTNGAVVSKDKNDSSSLWQLELPYEIELL